MNQRRYNVVAKWAWIIGGGVGFSCAIALDNVMPSSWVTWVLGIFLGWIVSVPQLLTDSLRFGTGLTIAVTTLYGAFIGFVAARLSTFPSSKRLLFSLAVGLVLIHTLAFLWLLKNLGLLKYLFS